MRGGDIPVGNIDQLFTYMPTIKDFDGEETISFVLIVRDTAGLDHELVDLDTPEQARWLKQRLEHHLGIVDRGGDSAQRQ